MFRPVIAHLRRYRVPLALMLCAWLNLTVAVAWAQPGGGCPTMDGAAAMHGSPMHGEGGPAAPACDCCAHAPTALPSTWSALAGAWRPARPSWRLATLGVPHPARLPLLRPPLA
ncbi:hypothetical protein [Dyella sp. A6]|uniref:hypothetical protein n=1 Tax=Dyella aluminiiresistens TaxID=3069105 RepID=UPI002E79CD5A|nr:hypothetical protein [Dyella sp. A6]